MTSNKKSGETKPTPPEATNVAAETQTTVVNPISTKDLLVQESKNVTNVNPTRVNFSQDWTKEEKSASQIIELVETIPTETKIDTPVTNTEKTKTEEK